jgi:hypothetical protein
MASTSAAIPRVAAPKFTATQFTPTPFDTAEQKARFANHFAAFMQAGFPETKFPPWFYRKLRTTFGHNAHYDRDGFHHDFFTTGTGRARFVRQTLHNGGLGDPAHTYSDVETAIHEWLEGDGAPLTGHYLRHH